MLTIRNLSRAGLGPIDLDLADGACVALAGPSGAGKTLFLRAIADLDPCDGTVILDGVARGGIPAPAWRKRVAYLAAESGWWQETVGGHFDDSQEVVPLFKRLGLGEDALRWQVTRLSTGERQRLALARLLLLKPRVMLLDEPTSALDPDSATRVETIMRERCQEGVSILFVTHDDGQAARLSGRRLRMTGGQLGETGR